MKIKCFIVFHEHLDERLIFENFSKQEVARLFKFYAVSERHKDKQVTHLDGTSQLAINPTPGIIFEQHLKNYKQEIQERGFMETSCYVHLLNNNLHANYDYIGISQYDMRWTKAAAKILRNLEGQSTQCPIPKAYGISCGKLMDNKGEYHPLAFANLCDWDFLLNSYNKFFGANLNRSMLIDKPLTLFQTYLLPQDEFIAMASWLNSICEEVYPWAQESPYQTHWGALSGYTERAESLFIAARIHQHQIEYYDLPLDHDSTIPEKLRIKKNHYSSHSSEPRILVNPKHSAPSQRKIQTSLGEGICVEGWRDLNHSYSLVNQWQLLELMRHTSKLRHMDVAPFNSNWNPITNGSGLPSDLAEKILQIPPPDNTDYFSSIYRISFPLNISDGPADKIFVFGTSETGRCTDMFYGSTPTEATRRGNLSIITPSKWSKIGFLSEGFCEDMIYILPHGVSAKSFYPVENDLRSFYRELLGFNQEDFIILNLGALTCNKGVDILIRAYLNLKPKHQRIKLVIKDQSNLYNRDVHNVISEMKAAEPISSLNEEHINEIISISGNLDLDDLRALYNSCDLYVSPYRAEGFNLPPLEAAACGTPIVVTEGGATDDYFTARLGLQIPSKLIHTNQNIALEPDLAELQRIIEEVMEKPKNWGGKDSSRFIHENYSWEKIGACLWGLLTKQEK